MSVFVSEESCNFVLHITDLKQIDHNQNMAKALKLHRQFGHATAEKLKRPVKGSGIHNKEFEKCIAETWLNCAVCEKFGRQN